jgi:hypothetical protein
MTMRATLSGSDQLAPLKATAKWMLGMSGSLMRTSDPVHRKGSCDGKHAKAVPAIALAVLVS